MRLTTLGRAGASEYTEDFAVSKKEQTAHSRPETAVHLLWVGGHGPRGHTCELPVTSVQNKTKHAGRMGGAWLEG